MLSSTECSIIILREFVNYDVLWYAIIVLMSRVADDLECSPKPSIVSILTNDRRTLVGRYLFKYQIVDEISVCEEDRKYSWLADLLTRSVAMCLVFTNSAVGVVFLCRYHIFPKL